MKKVFLLFLLFAFVHLEAQIYSLKECVETALKNKETLKFAALEIQSALAGKKGSLSNILPSIQYGNFWSETNTPGGTSNSFGSSISVNQTIYDGGQWLNQIKSANNNLTIAKQSARLQMITVVLDVHESFYELLKAQELLDVAKKTLELARQQIDLVNLQFELGAVKKTDLLKAEVQLGRSKTDILIKETSMRLAELNLRNSMGLVGTQTNFTIIDLRRPPLPLPDLEQSIAEMEEYNPTLLVTKSQIAGFELNRRILYGTRLPILNASVRYGSTTEEFQELTQMDQWASTVSLAFSIPVFTGYSLSSREQQATLAVRKQQYNYITQKNNLQVQLENLLNSIEDFQELIPLNEQILASAEEDLKLVHQRYSLGSLTILEVLDAQVSVSEARSSLVTTKYNARIQEAQLRAILGTLDQDYR